MRSAPPSPAWSESSASTSPSNCLSCWPRSAPASTANLRARPRSGDRRDPPCDGVRFDTIRATPLAPLDRISGRVEVMTKGGMVMQGKVDAKGMADVRAHLGLHPQTDSPALFVTDVGKALTYWDGRQIWRCIQQRSGVRRLGSHLIRHTDGKNM